MRKEKLEELKSYIEELKITAVEPTLFPATFLTTQKNIYHLNNGKSMTRELIYKGGKEGSAVVILPLTKEKNTVLVVEPRIGSSKTVSVGLPAGYIEKGEDPFLAASRELAEETGYQCKSLRLLARYYQDPGCSKAYNYAFLGFDARKTGIQNLDPEEYVRYFECYYEEALELINLGYIEDLQAQYILEKAKQYIYK